jgi:hypothetical protein
MVHLEPRLGLPLMHHLVEHRVLDFGPGVTRKVPAAHGDLERAAGAELHAYFAQPAPHPAGDADRYLAERAAEVLGVETLMELGQTVEQQQIAGSGALAPG